MLQIFDTTFQKTNEWLNQIMQSLGWEEPHRAYLGLRAVLHTLRDRLPVVEAAHFGAQLPMLVRGIYYEGWTPAGKPVKWDRDEFLVSVWNEFRQNPDIDPERVVRAVFEVILKHVDEGEIRKVRQVLPREFAAWWPVGLAA